MHWVWGYAKERSRSYLEIKDWKACISKHKFSSLIEKTVKVIKWDNKGNECREGKRIKDKILRNVTFRGRRSSFSKEEVNEVLYNRGQGERKPVEDALNFPVFQTYRRGWGIRKNYCFIGGRGDGG